MTPVDVGLILLVVLGLGIALWRSSHPTHDDGEPATLDTRGPDDR